MDETLRDNTNDSPTTGRRRFLAQLTAAGAAASAGVTLPASAQEKGERPWMTQGSPDQVSVGETLAKYAVNLKYEDLPPEVVRTAKRIIIDTLGCGAYKAEPTQIAIKLASNVSAKNGATIL